jgi:hypothetical protein
VTREREGPHKYISIKKSRCPIDNERPGYPSISSVKMLTDGENLEQRLSCGNVISIVAKVKGESNIGQGCMVAVKFI